MARAYAHEVRNDEGLSDDAMRAAVPSIYAQEPYHRMSERYQFVSTAQVITAMRGEGFVPVRAMQSKAMTPDRRSYTRHLVVFRAPGSVESPLARVGDVRPEIVLVNAHDGTASYQLHAGLFRLICSNGLIVADGSFASLKVMHFGRGLADAIVEGSYTVINGLPRVLGQVERWRSLPLPVEAQVIYARAALTLRYGDAERAPVQPAALLAPRRGDDGSDDLWTVYNRVQENVIRGGLPGQNARGRATTTRSIGGVARTVGINKGLWGLTNSLAGAVENGDDPNVIEGEIISAVTVDDDTARRRSEAARRAVETRRQRLAAALA